MSLDILWRSTLPNTTICYYKHLMRRLSIIYFHKQGSDDPLFRSTCWAPFATVIIRIYAFKCVDKKLNSELECIILNIKRSDNLFIFILDYRTLQRGGGPLIGGESIKTYYLSVFFRRIVWIMFNNLEIYPFNLIT